MKLEDLNWEEFYTNEDVCCVDGCRSGPHEVEYGNSNGLGLCSRHFYDLYDADERNQEPNLET